MFFNPIVMEEKSVAAATNNLTRSSNHSNTNTTSFFTQIALHSIRMTGKAGFRNEEDSHLEIRIFMEYMSSLIVS